MPLSSLNPFHRPVWTHPLPDGAAACEDLSYQYGRRSGEALHQVSLVVPPGSVLGLLGLNGAGKSTLLRLLFGLLKPTTGRAAVLGLDPTRDAVALRSRVGYVMDTPRFHDWMTVGETLAYHAHYRKGRWDWALTHQMLEEFELAPTLRMNALSKGMGVKAALIAALAFRPDLLILDEPTLGLDPQARRQLIQGVLAQAASDGRTVIISSHQIAEISGVVDRVAILRRGRLDYNGTTEDFLGDLRRIRLSWSEGEGAAPPSAPTDLPYLRYMPAGREAVLCYRISQAPHLAEAEAVAALFPGATATREPLNLEEAFLDFAGTEGRQGERQS